jgi:hypothetical protein
MNNVVFTQDVTLIDIIIRYIVGIALIIGFVILIIDAFKKDKRSEDDTDFDDDYLEDEI